MKVPDGHRVDHHLHVMIKSGHQKGTAAMSSAPEQTRLSTPLSENVCQYVPTPTQES